MPHAFVKPVFDKSVRNLCVQSYPRHPKGCPNFNKKKGCPPNVPVFWDIYDTTRLIFVIWNVFDLAGHVQRIKGLHPNWSQAQLECCLYWQGTARKQLKQQIKRWLQVYPDMHAETCPEAMGVNVTATMKDIGVELEWPPVKNTIQVALLAYPIKGITKCSNLY